MTDLRKAARHAKDVLDYVDRFLNMNKVIRDELVKEAIADLEKALAQPEKESIGTIRFINRKKAPQIEWAVDVPIWHGAKLYTAPSKREFVGLTDNEVMDAYCKTPPFCSYLEAFTTGIRFIESKLREKNEKM